MLSLEKGIFKTAIIPSIIGSIIFSMLIQPLFQNFGPKLLTFISNSFVILGDSIYRKAAQGIIYKSGTALIYLIAGCIMGTFLGILSLQIRRKKQSTNSSDRIPIYVFALFFVWSISLFWIGYSESTAIQLNVSFNQKVAIISPFITDRDEKILKAEWASMRNYSDYKKINERLNKIANTNHIVFP